MRRVIVIGTGLIGTSVALALRERGIEVLLADRDARSAQLAVELGAGVALDETELDDPADLAVLAVPPAAVAATLLDAQKRGLARVHTDVASVKARPLAEAAALGCDLAGFVAGHPLAGRERSGPAAARADLFLGRPWALCPTQESGPDAHATVSALVKTVGGEPVTFDPRHHDQVMALVSHAPHVVSAAMSARLADASDIALGMAGQGVRDVTRIAAGDPGLWTGILTANAQPVAAVLEAVAADLTTMAAALRAGTETRAEAQRDEVAAAAGRVVDILERGAAGQARIPGKHGGRASPYTVVSVVVPDRAGELALLFQVAAIAGVNIEDVSIEHSPGLPVGVVELSVQPESAPKLADELRARGWSVPR